MTFISETRTLFVTMNPYDANNFETATLVGYDGDGNQVSSVSYDYEEVKDTQMGKRAIDYFQSHQSPDQPHLSTDQTLLPSQPIVSPHSEILSSAFH